MLKVLINRKACIGNEMCTHIAREVFKIGEDGKSSVYHVAPEWLEEINEAADCCPVGAIIVEEED
jgi:ferredoxin